jgi:hypothetical protein
MGQKLQHIVRACYKIDPHATLQFEVSTWDVCAGNSVEVTEAAYVPLAPFMDNVSVVMAYGACHRILSAISVEKR